MKLSSEPAGLEALPASVRRAVSNVGTWALALAALRRLKGLAIPFIILKSLPQVEQLYGHAGGRRTTDVDILVHAGDCARTLEALAGLGWEMTAGRTYDFLRGELGKEEAASSRPWHLTRVDTDFAGAVDLHPDCMPPWSSPMLTPEVWERATPAVVDGIEFFLMSPEDRLLHLCWHAFAHGLEPDHVEEVRLAFSSTPLDGDYIAVRARRTATVGVLDFLQHRLPIPPPARIKVTSNIRQRLAGWLCGAEIREVGSFSSFVLRVLLHDRLHEMWPYAREWLLPDRRTIAADYLYRWPGGREYLATIGRLYVDRVMEHTAGRWRSLCSRAPTCEPKKCSGHRRPQREPANDGGLHAAAGVRASGTFLPPGTNTGAVAEDMNASPSG